MLCYVYVSRSHNVYVVFVDSLHNSAPCHAVWWGLQSSGCRTSCVPPNIPTHGNCADGCRCCVSEYVHFDLNARLIHSRSVAMLCRKLFYGRICIFQSTPKFFAPFEYREFLYCLFPTGHFVFRTVQSMLSYLAYFRADVSAFVPFCPARKCWV